MSKKNIAGLLLSLLTVACAIEPPTPPLPSWKPTTYEALHGFEQDRLSEALVPLRTACRAAMKKNDAAPFGAGKSAALAGPVAAWRPVCADAEIVPDGNDTAALAFFRRALHPYVLAPQDAASGLFTGYYEPELLGATTQGGIFQTPLWQTPNDLVRVDLGDFADDLKGRRLVGKIDQHKLKPYDERRQIAAGSLAQPTETGEPRAKPLVWVSNPIDAFFLEVQGSGRILLPDGKTLRVGYDSQNGHGYTAIGRVLLDEGKIDRPVTMPKIRAWLENNPDQAQAVMNRNPSVVFFRQRDEGEPLGALGLPLTAERSLAIDPSFMPLGVPLWLDVGAPASPRMVVTMDTGGAIKGQVRGDLFWGRGPRAEQAAGQMQASGTYYLLLPLGVAPPPVP